MVAVIVQEGFVHAEWVREPRRRLGGRSSASSHRSTSPSTRRVAAWTKLFRARPCAGIAAAVERGRVRGPGCADEPPQHDEQLAREAAVGAHRQLRQAGFAVHAVVAGVARPSRDGPNAQSNVSPVVGAKIISGLVPCNAMPDEILTDHPARYRAMLVESGNPAALAGRQPAACARRCGARPVGGDRRRDDRDRALKRTTCCRRHAVREVGSNVLQLRLPAQRVPPAPAGAGPARRAAARARDPRSVGARRWASSPTTTSRRCARLPSGSRGEFAAAFFEATAPTRARAVAPVVLYRTLGPTLPDGAASAALLWGAAHRCAMGFEASVRRAGFTGEGPGVG
jgi:hypothetical protein